MAFITENYPGKKDDGTANNVLQFTDRFDKPAAIDTTTKPIRVEFADGTLADIPVAIILPTGNVGEYTFDFNTLAVGICDGDFVADPDMTPAGESEIRVHFSIPIMNEQATGGSVSLGAGVAKP